MTVTEVGGVKKKCSLDVMVKKKKTTLSEEVTFGRDLKEGRNHTHRCLEE